MQRFAPGRGSRDNPFLQALAPSFEGAVKARGEEYLQKVHFLSASAEQLSAKVAGSWLYQVEVKREGTRLVASCTCPYTERFDSPCKHVWATLTRAALDQLEFARTLPTGFRARSAASSPLGTEPSSTRAREPLAESDEFDSDLEEDSGYSASSGNAGGLSQRGARSLDDFVSDELDQSALAPDSTSGRGSRPPSGASPVDAPWYSAFERLSRSEVSARASSVLYGLDPDDLRQGICRVYLMRRARVVSAEALDMAPTFEPLRDVGSALGRDARPLEHWLRASAEDDARVRFSAFRAANVPVSALPGLVPELCATGRCFLVRAVYRASGGVFQPLTPAPLQWEAGAPYLLELLVSEGDGAARFRLEGFLVRGEERVSISVPEVVTPSGIVIWGERATRCELGDAEPMLGLLRDSRYRWVLSESDLEELSRSHAALEAPVRLSLPAGFELRDEVAGPVPLFSLDAPTPGGVPARVSFAYGEQHVSPGAEARSVIDWPAKARYARQPELEQQRLGELAEQGLPALLQREDGVPLRRPKALVLPAKKVPALARALLEKGWRVEAQGKAYRAAGQFNVSVRSGIDWFDFDARLDFGQTSAALPELLRALKHKSALVALDDGTLGVLPEEWLERWGVLEGMTGLEDGKLRFRRAELPLLAALVERAPDADVDRGFLKLRREFERFSGVEPAEPPKSFRGELRPYQSHGLGWLQFLTKMGFGGCLADDMGLGKTVQVIAWLASRPGRGRPTLIVVPRSLVFNWQQELERFAPRLKVAVHLGAVRSQTPEFEDTDVVLTTYGTLLRDITRLQKVRFFAAILDEAQAIKNHTSQTAKAARLLSADQRLALSGTPIENHLGELWSLFEFLNPNLLGRAKGLKKAAEGARGVDDAGIQFLSRVLRPFVLRRSKAEVAKDLPERSEQTLYIELGKEEKAHYAEILRHFQVSLQKKVAAHGLERSTPHVLEALLRLRQAACHAGLLDPKRREEPSAKLEVLLAHLEELVERGMKSLVFSQFTSFLSIVREELDRRGIVYEYLDGDTQDRKARVDNFQSESGPRVFLISLKAGGVGLNLTQAEYVFLLDPWWNPAVEAQAIDRAHRIGQTRRVVAYRLIAKDTVEQKVEALQHRKRELAAALFGEGAAFTGKLTREDLTALLE
ncbi:MAG TPA: DEAD/DEAH box helicase [Polyangiaceae bacterium]|nr:DEAD/DEAH box helicase [Polyangiaceae bacterium]